MKIAPKAVESFLKLPSAEIGAILLYGPDQGLARECANRLIEQRVPERGDPFNFAEISEELLKAEPTRLAEEMAALSFTGGDRVVFIRAAADKHATQLAEAMSVRSPRTLLVVCSDDLGPRSALRQLFEKEAGFAALACYHDEGQNVEALLRSKLEAASVSASREVIDYVVQQLGNDRMVTQSEIEKLLLFADSSGRLSLEDARAVIAGNRLADTDDLAYALALGDIKSLEPLLQQFQREGAQPVALLRGAARYFQRLYAARLEVEQGQRVEEAVAAMKPPVFFRDVPRVTGSLRRWNTQALRRAMGWLNEAELATKTQGLSPALIANRVFYRIAMAGAAVRAA